MSYQPNPNNKAFIRRANLALEFVDKYVKNTPNWLSTRWIHHKDNFGAQANPLSQWLRAKLLICVDEYYNFETGKCKRYIKNSAGYKEVTDLLNGNIKSSITSEQQQQLDTGDFDYDTKSNRDYTWAQYIPKHKRNKLLNNNGYKYHYDIEAAAPTLLLQRAQAKNPNFLASNLEYYINNRSEMRQKIAVACHITEHQVKDIINSILQGGVISPYYLNKTFTDILMSNYASVHLLNTNKDIIALKQDIKSLWGILRDEMPVRYYPSGRKMKVSPRDKSDVYRSLETEVGKSVRRYLKKKSVRYLWIHDGWSCDDVVDPHEIVREVRKQTGYAIKLDWTIYED